MRFSPTRKTETLDAKIGPLGYAAVIDCRVSPVRVGKSAAFAGGAVADLEQVTVDGHESAMGAGADVGADEAGGAAAQRHVRGYTGRTGAATQLVKATGEMAIPIQCGGPRTEDDLL